MNLGIYCLRELCDKERLCILMHLQTLEAIAGRKVSSILCSESSPGLNARSRQLLDTRPLPYLVVIVLGRSFYQLRQQYRRVPDCFGFVPTWSSKVGNMFDGLRHMQLVFCLFCLRRRVNFYGRDKVRVLLFERIFQSNLSLRVQDFPLINTFFGR